MSQKLWSEDDVMFGSLPRTGVKPNRFKEQAPKINPFAPPPPPVFCPFLKISLGDPCLKILDLTKLFAADATMQKIQKKIYLLSEHFELWF